MSNKDYHPPDSNSSSSSYRLSSGGGGGYRPWRGRPSGSHASPPPPSSHRGYNHEDMLHGEAHQGHRGGSMNGGGGGGDGGGHHPYPHHPSPPPHSHSHSHSHPPPHHHQPGQSHGRPFRPFPSPRPYRPYGPSPGHHYNHDPRPVSHPPADASFRPWRPSFPPQASSPFRPFSQSTPPGPRMHPGRSRSRSPPHPSSAGHPIRHGHTAYHSTPYHPYSHGTHQEPPRPFLSAKAPRKTRWDTPAHTPQPSAPMADGDREPLPPSSSVPYASEPRTLPRHESAPHTATPVASRSSLMSNFSVSAHTSRSRSHHAGDLFSVDMFDSHRLLEEKEEEEGEEKKSVLWQVHFQKRENVEREKEKEHEREYDPESEHEQEQELELEIEHEHEHEHRQEMERDDQGAKITRTDSRLDNPSAKVGEKVQYETYSSTIESSAEDPSMGTALESSRATDDEERHSQSSALSLLSELNHIPAPKMKTLVRQSSLELELERIDTQIASIEAKMQELKRKEQQGREESIRRDMIEKSVMSRVLCDKDRALIKSIQARNHDRMREYYLSTVDSDTDMQHELPSKIALPQPPLFAGLSSAEPALELPRFEAQPLQALVQLALSRQKRLQGQLARRAIKKYKMARKEWQNEHCDLLKEIDKTELDLSDEPLKPRWQLTLAKIPPLEQERPSLLASFRANQVPRPASASISRSRMTTKVAVQQPDYRHYLDMNRYDPSPMTTQSTVSGTQQSTELSLDASTSESVSATLFSVCSLPYYTFRPFTKTETQAFMEKYLWAPKRWEYISRGLPGRSISEIVQYYYENKKRLQFKKWLRSSSVSSSNALAKKRSGLNANTTNYRRPTVMEYEFLDSHDEPGHEESKVAHSDEIVVIDEPESHAASHSSLSLAPSTMDTDGMSVPTAAASAASAAPAGTATPIASTPSTSTATLSLSGKRLGRPPGRKNKTLSLTGAATMEAMLLGGEQELLPAPPSYYYTPMEKYTLVQSLIQSGSPDTAMPALLDALLQYYRHRLACSRAQMHASGHGGGSGGKRRGESSDTMQRIKALKEECRTEGILIEDEILEMLERDEEPRRAELMARLEERIHAFYQAYYETYRMGALVPGAVPPPKKKKKEKEKEKKEAGEKKEKRDKKEKSTQGSELEPGDKKEKRKYAKKEKPESQKLELLSALDSLSELSGLASLAVEETAAFKSSLSTATTAADQDKPAEPESGTGQDLLAHEEPQREEADSGLSYLLNFSEYLFESHFQQSVTDKESAKAVLKGSPSLSNLEGTLPLSSAADDLAATSKRRNSL